MEGKVFKQFLKERRINNAELARQWGMSKQNLSQMFNSRVLSDDTKKQIETHFKTKWDTIKATVKVDATEQSTPKEADRTLFNLTESNKKLADAGLINSEALKTLADSHSKLVDKLIASEAKEIQLVDPATLTDLLVVLAEVGVAAKKWKSPQEAHAALYKIGAGTVVKKKAKGIRDGVGR